MQLAKKKALATRVLKVGLGRVVFAAGHEEEIKEAITRQDILDLVGAGAIQIKEMKGRKKVVRRKHRRRAGKIKKKVNTQKRDYAKLTRKLRKTTQVLLSQKKINKETKNKIKRMIRAKKFRSKRHLQEQVGEL